MATACRNHVERCPADPASALNPEAAAEEFVELAALIAACRGQEAASVFAEILERVARAWPALTPILHQAAGNLAARTPSGRAADLWLAQSTLGSR